MASEDSALTGSDTAMLSLAALDRLVAAGAPETRVDTVIVAFPDMQGRLVGKRMDARLFVDEAAATGVECCGYLLAVDVDMNTVGGYAISGWDTGYGDLVMRPDLSTLRRIPWLPGTALVIADVVGADGSPVAVSPRAVLRRQLDRLAGRGLFADAATELEFMVFDEPYRQAWASGYRGLTPASDYNIDYAISASSRMEPLLRDIRRGMAGAGLRFESVKGECNRGQQEIGFRYDEALRTCDNHVIYKNGAKEIADQHGKSLTFMAKYDEREGNSCHVHLSLRDAQGGAAFADPAARTACRRCSAASWPACWPPWQTSRCSTRRTSTPTSDSPMRVSRPPRWPGDWTTAPARCGWSATARTPASSAGFPAAMSTRIWRWRRSSPAGCTVSSRAWRCRNLRGQRLPRPRRRPAAGHLAEAAALFEHSALARQVFGDDVVAHYLNNARVELAAFHAAATDWERMRGFERL